MFAASDTSLVKNTTHKVVVPFYTYAAISFLVATSLLYFSTSTFSQHYFQPHTLAITHTMALGWGTMIIVGASHQLVPVLIEGQLYSNRLAYLSFWLAGAGIPLLIYSFYFFRFDWTAQVGAALINAGILSYLINLAISVLKSRKENVHAIFVFTAAVWLFITTMIGLLLVFNFTETILSNDSLHYLSLHAHIGIVGWFLLLIIGVGSRLIPMFLISKYDNPKRLWLIYILINTGLLTFIALFLLNASTLYIIPIGIILIALLLFAKYCQKAYQQRIRKKTDEQIRAPLLSIALVIVPVLLLLIFIFCLNRTQLVIAYGFTIFFGWITAIIFGMTFKTLPFIIWNKIYHDKAATTKTPNPKDLFSNSIFNCMLVTYLAGFILFSTGTLLTNIVLLQAAAVLLIITAALYNWNVMKVLLHKQRIL